MNGVHCFEFHSCRIYISDQVQSQMVSLNKLISLNTPTTLHRFIADEYRHLNCQKYWHVYNTIPFPKHGSR